MDEPYVAHCWDDVVDADAREIYKAYQHGQGIGQRPALLAVDLYNLVYAGGPQPVRDLVDAYPSSCGIAAWQAIEPTRRLLAAARSAGAFIIYSTSTRQLGTPRTIAATKRSIQADRAEDFNIKAEFTPRPEDLIIYKDRASAFYGTSLVTHLVARGIDTLIVCGESTSGCVRASVVDAYSNGFTVLVVEECCFDRLPLSHKVNLFDMHHKYANVVHIEDVCAMLEHWAEGSRGIRRGSMTLSD